MLVEGPAGRRQVGGCWGGRRHWRGSEAWASCGRAASMETRGGLTPSERRIAQLAATGQTNREIADGL